MYSKCIYLQTKHFKMYIFTNKSYTVQLFNSCTSRLDFCQCLVVQIPMDNMSTNMPSTSMTHVATESKLRSVVCPSMHPCQGNLGGDKVAQLVRCRTSNQRVVGSILGRGTLVYPWARQFIPYCFSLLSCKMGT